MSENNNSISREEARSTLESINLSRSKTARLSRPPLWMNVLSTALLGCTILSSNYYNGWYVLLFFVAFMSTYVWWGNICKSKGLSIFFLPRTAKGWVFLNVVGAIYLVSIAVSHEYYMDGYTWAPLIGAAICCITFSLVIHFQPTGDWTCRESV